MLMGMGIYPIKTLLLLWVAKYILLKVFTSDKINLWMQLFAVVRKLNAGKLLSRTLTTVHFIRNFTRTKFFSYLPKFLKALVLNGLNSYETLKSLLHQMIPRLSLSKTSKKYCTSIMWNFPKPNLITCSIRSMLVQMGTNTKLTLQEFMTKSIT
jgi:hypothetical protein